MIETILNYLIIGGIVLFGAWVVWITGLVLFFISGGFQDD